MAIHTASLEVPKMLGIIVPNHFGAARLIKLYIDVLTKIRTTTIADLMIALITLSVLITARIIKDKYDHRLKFPIPFEIALLLIGIIASYFGKLESSYSVTVLGDVPSGIPQPTIPSFNRASRIATDSIVIAILSFTMSISLAKTIPVSLSKIQL
jgi:MFS superfamily sulfate permease-like transporter